MAARGRILEKVRASKKPISRDRNSLVGFGYKKALVNQAQSW